MDRNDEFTLITSKGLDSLGYSPRMVKRRQKAYDNFSTSLTLCQRNLGFPGISSTISGSKREGLAGPLQSDIDLMTIWDNVIATRNLTTVRQSTQIIFKLDDDTSPAGYTKLKLIYIKDKHDPIFELVEAGLFYETPRTLYLSSRYFMSSLEENDISESKSWLTVEKQTRHGPSLPKLLTYNLIGLTFDSDNVTAFPCKCTQILKSWASRSRLFGWPQKEIKEKVAFSESHVVPVGLKLTEDEFSLWRICCTHAEIILIQSLNETQWKLYVLLKMLKGSLLESISDGMTSYLMKNILLWVIENNPIESFQLKFLHERFLQCISFLRQCVYEKFVPSYMIPSRNLLLGKLSTYQHKRLLCKLDDILNNGEAVVLILPDLQKAMADIVVQPDMAMFYMKSRDNAEEVYLMDYFLPTSQQADLFKNIFNSTSEDELGNLYRPLTRLKSCNKRLAILCRDINITSENGFKALMAQIEKQINTPRLLDHYCKAFKRSDPAIVADIFLKVLENVTKEQPYRLINRLIEELEMNEVAMDIAKTMLYSHNKVSLFDVCSTLCQECPSTIQNIFKISAEMPEFRQCMVTLLGSRINIRQLPPMDQNDSASIQNLFESRQCAADFQGPDSPFARMLSRK